MFAVRLWPLVLIAALGAVPIGPPEHVHETTDEAGHVSFVAHRHVQLHGLETWRTDGHHTVDHPDPVTVVPDGAYTVAGAYVLHAPALESPIPIAMPRVGVVVREAHASDQLIHAPPRAPASPRAPPAFPA